MAGILVWSLALLACSNSTQQPAVNGTRTPDPATRGSALTSAPAGPSGGRQATAAAKPDLGPGPGPNSIDRNALAGAASTTGCKRCGVISQIAAVGRDGQRTEYVSNAAIAGSDVAYYNVTVRLDAGTDMVVRARQAPTMSVGAAVDVVNGELVAR